MNNISIIGSDSFIATLFIHSLDNNINVRLFTKQLSNKFGEILRHDLFQINSNDLMQSDIVINFAAIVHKSDLNDEKLYKRINTDLPIHLANQAKKSGVKHFIQISTIAVYGNQNPININSIENPKNHYSNSKWNADIELLALQDERFKISIIRPPMVYGGGKAPGNMIRLIKLVDCRIPLPFKNIDNKRDFIHVNNLVQYLSIIAQKQLHGVFIVSDKEPVSTEYLVKAISKSLGKKDSLISIPSFILKALKWIRPNEYYKLFGTLRLENNFPYEDLIQRYTVDNGIEEMVVWYRNNKGKKLAP